MRIQWQYPTVLLLITTSYLQDPFFLKTDEHGEDIFSGETNDIFFSAVQCNDGGLIIVGVANAMMQGDGLVLGENILIKTYSEGRI
ncbi:hypothetical protein JXQ70_11290 [bacterium]|nr:hypothetical protein [bacterium]